MQFLVTCKRQGVKVYASGRNLQGVFDANVEFAYVYDSESNDSPEFKASYWRGVAKIRGLDPADVAVEEVVPCAS